MKIKSLKSRQDSLAQTEKQLEILSGGIFKDGSLPTFKEKVKASNLAGCSSHCFRNSTN